MKELTFKTINSTPFILNCSLTQQSLEKDNLIKPHNQHENNPNITSPCPRTTPRRNRNYSLAAFLSSALTMGHAPLLYQPTASLNSLNPLHQPEHENQNFHPQKSRLSSKKFASSPKKYYLCTVKYFELI